MKIGEAYLETKVSTAGLKSDLMAAENISRGAVGKMQSIFSTLKIALPAITAGAVLYGLKNIVSETARAGDMFDKMSQRVGVSVEELSALKYVADISGTSIESLEMSLRYLSQRMLDVKKGSGEAKDTFDKLGISVYQADGKLKSTTDVMREVADRLSVMEDETLKAAYAAEIFGARSGTQLLPMLNMGSAGIEDLAKKAEKLGGVFTTEGAATAAKFEYAMTDLKTASEGLAKEFSMTLIPTLTDMADLMTFILEKTQGLLKITPPPGAPRELTIYGKEKLEADKKRIAELSAMMGIRILPPGKPPIPVIPIEEFEKEYAPEIFTPEERRKYLFERPFEEIEDYADKIKKIELSEPIDFWAEKQKELWESAARDFENIFYNPFTDRVSGMKDIWGQTCDFMRKRFAKTLSDMITDSAAFKRLIGDFDAIIAGIFKQGGSALKSAIKYVR